MSEDRPTISSSRVSATEVARHTFATVRRGFEPGEVRAYLEVVARELAAWEGREAELRERLAEAEERARHPVLDEATLSAALGQQSARVLRHAHDEAARVAAQAEESAAAVLRDSHQAASDLRVEAEGTAAERIAEAELAASALEAQAREAAEAAMAAARAEGEAMIERAREQGRAVLAKVQAARKEVLSDLARRRKALHLQIEQFRAARDEIAASVLGVRESVDAIVTGLHQADDRARAAAQDVARRGVPEPDAGPEAALLDEVAEVPDLDDVEGFTVVGVVDVPGAEVAGPGPVPADGEDGEDGEDASVVSTSVDELFARIRAGRPDDVPPVPSIPAPAPAPAPAAAREDPVAPAGGDGGEPGGPEEGAEEAGVDEALLDLRASVLDPIVATLTRRLKRTMADDQNQLLARLRNGTPSAGELLVPEADQRAAYVEAATEQLRQALAAGASFARELSAEGDAPEPDPARVDAMAEELAAEVVRNLRRRLEEGDASVDPAERVGAAFREWRGERIERLVGDVALSAFSEGVLAGAGGAPVRWLLAAGTAACADCDDNSLADPVAPGGEFPTGHRHPPAHAGCRCLVAPAPA